MRLNPFRWFEKKDATLNSADIFSILGGGSAPGGTISSEAALRCTSVQCATRAIAETIGSMPCHVFGRHAEGAKERNSNHAAEPLVAREANPWTRAGMLRQLLVTDAMLEGNGYGAVIKVDNVPREIHRLDPKSTRIDMVSGEPVYIFTDAKGERRYRYDEVVHVPSPITSDGITGIAPRQMASNAIRFALELEQHGVALFRNAAKPGGVLKHQKTLSAEAQARLRIQFEQYSGLAATGKPLLMEEGMEWQQVQLNSVDSQYHELRQFAVAEIARAFRVPPVLLMDYGRATWGNSAEMGQQFLTYSLMPWIKALEFAYGRALLSKEERAEFYFEFVVDDLLRADISKRMAAYRQAIDGGFLTPNEARAFENRPPLEGGDKLRPAPKLSAPANDNEPAKDSAAA